MAKVTTNVLVLYTKHGEVLDVLVGSPITVLNGLKKTSYYDTMMEEWLEDDFPESNQYSAVDFLSSMSDFYDKNESFTVKIKYFSNKTFHDH